MSMVSSELVALAKSGANALVDAMGTSAWGSTRDRFVVFLNRGRKKDWTGGALDGAAERLATGVTSRDIQLEVWRSHLELVLVEDEKAADALQELTAETPSAP
ncbi:hypothetical protein [Paractinoplanes globisporus]|jgi:hypothetical protein|uniref:Uncharacterized protein n=1 Tax=Paractinoplanes globisporus TaxID=113565 RepID=A0ABW6W658_9ACTN|nr:hypothetical protein [Actinoplanes globisporus]